MAKDEKEKQQPFHESIVVAINKETDRGRLETLAGLIIVTKVPAGHREIIEALRVKSFQIGDAPTAIKAIAVLEAQEAEKAEKTKGNPENLLFPGPFMEKGSTGAAVAVLQVLLKAIDVNPAVKVDGDFGEETAKGIRLLQDAYGIEVNGKCGPDMREKIYERTGIELNALPADLFKKETVTVPPEPWVK